MSEHPSEEKIELRCLYQKSGTKFNLPLPLILSKNISMNVSRLLLILKLNKINLNTIFCIRDNNILVLTKYTFGQVTPTGIRNILRKYKGHCGQLRNQISCWNFNWTRMNQ